MLSVGFVTYRFDKPMACELCTKNFHGYFPQSQADFVPFKCKIGQEVRNSGYLLSVNLG